MTDNLRTTARLADPTSLLTDIDLVAADIDYTLVDFGAAHIVALEVLAKLFNQSISDQVGHYFDLTLAGLRKPVTEVWSEREAFDKLIAQVEELHRNFADSYGPRVWSRETWLHMADPSLSTAQLEQGRDAYWQGIGQGAKFYSDTQLFLDYLKAKNIPLILMTGSDSILKISDGPIFDYDPVFAEQYKHRRLNQLPFGAAAIIIGDPVDKPDQAFFTRVTDEINKLGQFHHDRILFMGDSLRNDLEVPRDLGFRTLLVQRDGVK